MFFEYQQDKFVNLDHVAEIKATGDASYGNRCYTFYDVNGKSLAKTEPGSKNNNAAANVVARLVAGVA